MYQSQSAQISYMPSGYRSSSIGPEVTLNLPWKSRDAVQLQIVQTICEQVTEEDVCEDEDSWYDIESKSKIQNS